MLAHSHVPPVRLGQAALTAFQTLFRVLPSVFPDVPPTDEASLAELDRLSARQDAAVARVLRAWYPDAAPWPGQEWTDEDAAKLAHNAQVALQPSGFKAPRTPVQLRELGLTVARFRREYPLADDHLRAAAAVR